MTRALWVAVLALGCAGVTRPTPERLTPPRDRITDEAIASDLALLDRWDARLVAARQANPNVDAAAYGEAEMWLRAARQAYTENDRSGGAQQALDRAIALIPPPEDAHGTSPFDSAAHDLGMARAAMELASWHADPVAACRDAWYYAVAEQLMREQLPPVIRIAPTDIPMAPIQTLDAIAVMVADTVPTPSAAEVAVVASSIHFAVNVATISAASRPELDRLVSLLQKYPSVFVRLDGHADARGTAAHNLALSHQRAASVRRYLLDGAVDSSRIAIGASGATPSVPRGSLEQYARDREVTVSLVGIDGRPIKAEAQERDLQVEHAPPRRRLSP
jgi:outer membrane protein OmpA-like peptidoglycan-associated protein